MLQLPLRPCELQQFRRPLAIPRRQRVVGIGDRCWHVDLVKGATRLMGGAAGETGAHIVGLVQDVGKCTQRRWQIELAHGSAEPQLGPTRRASTKTAAHPHLRNTHMAHNVKRCSLGSGSRHASRCDACLHVYTTEVTPPAQCPTRMVALALLRYCSWAQASEAQDTYIQEQQ